MIKTPLFKGVVTGALLVVTTLLLFSTKQKASSGLQYIAFAIYAGGIAWTLIDYSRSPAYTGKFGDIFGQGFRCFIIVTLIMVTFTGIFFATHPEYAQQDGELYREFLKKEGNRTPDQIASMVASEKKYYTVKNMYSTVFGTLIPGAIFTAAGAGLLLLRRK